MLFASNSEQTHRGPRDWVGPLTGNEGERKQKDEISKEPTGIELATCESSTRATSHES